MSYGADPEFFVVKEGQKQATSIHLVDTFKPGDMSNKGNPLKTHGVSDGFAFELNTDRGSNCRDYLNPAFAEGIKKFHVRNPGYTLSPKAAMRLTARSTRGKTPEGVCDYGCVPDRDAYVLEEKTPPGTSYKDSWRYTGGHIHVSIPGFGTNNMSKTYHNQQVKAAGWPAPNDTERRELLAAAHTIVFDRFVGLPMVALLGENNDYGEARRRTYYGQAGSHRVKPYGFEYRVLSGMLMQSPFMFTWVLGQVKHIMRKEMQTFVYKNRPNTTYGKQLMTDDELVTAVTRWMDDWDLADVAAMINEHDYEAARQYVAKNSLIKYQPKFYKAVVNADMKGRALSTNLAQTWDIGANIVNHTYPGIEKFLQRVNLQREREPALVGGVAVKKTWATT